MASKKEIKEYVKIKLEKVKKEKISYPNEKDYLNKYTEDKFLIKIFDMITRRNWNGTFQSIFIEPEIAAVAPAIMHTAVSDINKEREVIYNKNKEIEQYNSKIDEKYKDFFTEMLLVGNGQLADFAKAFIDSLTDVK